MARQRGRGCVDQLPLCVIDIMLFRAGMDGNDRGDYSGMATFPINRCSSSFSCKPLVGLPSVTALSHDSIDQFALAPISCPKHAVTPESKPCPSNNSDVNIPPKDINESPQENPSPIIQTRY